jgi:tetratricopeptide (TPR) repeat protein
VNGYIVVGDVQGNLYGPNSGDAAGAMQSYQNALRIASELRKAAPGDADAQSAAARANVAVADVLAADGDRTRALAMYREAQAIIETGESPRKSSQLASLAPKIALAEMQLGNTAAALSSYRTALSLAEQNADTHPADAKSRHAVAYGKERVGVVLAMSGEYQAAEHNLREALLLYQQLSSPGTSGERDVADTHLELGDVLKAQGRNVEALREYEDGLRICEKLAADDASNVRSRRNLHIALGRLADLCIAMGRRENARRYTLRALRVLRPMVDAPTASPYDLQQFAWLLLTTPFPDLQDPEAALNAAAKAVTLTNRTDPAILNILAIAHFAGGDARRAVAIEEEALRRVPPGKSATRDEIESNLARFQASGSRTFAPPQRQ